MQTFENTLTIQAPLAEVFAYLSEFENIPKWNYAIERTERVEPGSVGVGTTYRQLRTVPERSEEGFTVMAFEPPQRLAIEGTIGPFLATLTYVLREVEGVTLLRNEVQLKAKSPVLRFMAPSTTPQVKKAMSNNLGKLKMILEGS